MSDFFTVITLNDVAFAFIGALTLTFLIKKLWGGYRFIGVGRHIKIDYSGRNLSMVIKSCYELFPKDLVTFNGATFKRGCRVQIQTIGNHKVTGELIGINSDNMICLITPKHIIAHELSQILDIRQVETIDNNNDGE